MDEYIYVNISSSDASEYDDPLSTPRQKKPVSRTAGPRPGPSGGKVPVVAMIRELRNGVKDLGVQVRSGGEVQVVATVRELRNGVKDRGVQVRRRGPSGRYGSRAAEQCQRSRSVGQAARSKWSLRFESCGTVSKIEECRSGGEVQVVATV
ncbi:hypothetical protein J6590_091085 [Homalodisca vitripennis]|nr:hypothetical protein J6590_091085 [Homalodisca vitripennis]